MTTVTAQPEFPADTFGFDEAIRAELESRVGGWIERSQSAAYGLLEGFEVEHLPNGWNTIKVRLQASGVEITSEPRGLRVAISATTHPATAVAVLQAALGAAGRRQFWEFPSVVTAVTELARPVPDYGTRCWFLPVEPGQARSRLAEVEKALAGDPLVECRWADAESAPTVLPAALQVLDERVVSVQVNDLLGHEPTAAEPTLLVLVPDSEHVWRVEYGLADMAARIARKGRKYSVALVVASAARDSYDVFGGAQVLRACMTIPQF